MNQKLRDLVKRSGMDVYGLGRDRERWEATVDKLAQSIVEDCAMVALNEGKHLTYQALTERIRRTLK